MNLLSTLGYLVTDFAPLLVAGVIWVLFRNRLVTGPAEQRVGQVESVVMTSLLMAAVGFQVVFFSKAGGLWRDEANSVNLANLPGIRDVWRHLDNDSFPMGWFLVLRLWSAAGLTGSDSATRALGLGLALAVIGALAFTSRSLGSKFPFISVVLFSWNPVVVRCIGANRAYGLGIAVMVLAYGLVWKALQNPTRRNMFATWLALTLAVHCIYYNALFAWAVTCGAIAVTALRHDWKQVCTWALMAIVTTLTVLPYLLVVQKQHQWSKLVAVHISPQYLVHTILAVCRGGLLIDLMLGLWALVLVVGFVMAYRAMLAPRSAATRSTDRDLGVLCTVSIVLSTCGFGLFLVVLQYPVSPWYYADLLALVAVSLDGIIGVHVGRVVLLRLIRIQLATSVAVVSFAPTLSAAATRQTNIDLLASHLSAQAKFGDQIVVIPWYLGTSFDRYYHGRAEWMTAPMLPTVKFGGANYAKALIASRYPVTPILDRIKGALAGGNRIFLIFDPQAIGAMGNTTVRGRQPLPVMDHNLWWYTQSWGLEVRSCLVRHSSRIGVDDALQGDEISTLEDPMIEIWQGWTDTRPRHWVRPSHLSPVAPSSL